MSMESGTENPLITIKATGTWRFGFNSTVRLENLEATDEPAESVQDIQTPSYVGQAIAALVGCTCVTISNVAKEMDFSHNGVDFVGQAEFSIDNLAEVDGAIRRFEAINGTVTIITEEEQDRFNDLVAEVQRRCPAYTILANAGVIPDIKWKKSGASA
jgi:uncharacterized OsmC-like protein